MAENTLQPSNGSEVATTGENHGVTITPRVDILEKDEELLLMADLPGVKADDVDIRYENGELSLVGRREPSHTDKRRSSWEYEVATYQRTFRLGENIAADKISAELKHGVLTLHLPKVEAVRPRKITVKG